MKAGYLGSKSKMLLLCFSANPPGTFVARTLLGIFELPGATATETIAAGVPRPSHGGHNQGLPPQALGT